MWYLLNEDGDIVEIFEDEDSAQIALGNVGNPFYCVVSDIDYF